MRLAVDGEFALAKSAERPFLASGGGALCEGVRLGGRLRVRWWRGGAYRVWERSASLQKRSRLTLARSCRSANVRPFCVCCTMACSGGLRLAAVAVPWVAGSARAAAASPARADRSEERRVGKECRSR